MIQFLANLIGVHDMVVQMVLLPFTYCPQSKELMSDVRSYVMDFRMVEAIYTLNFNDTILMTDLVNFCENQGFTPTQTHLIANIPAVDMFIQTGYYPEINPDHSVRISRLLWGIFTREQRTQFINEYILYGV
jgi:hypothetical protein